MLTVGSAARLLAVVALALVPIVIASLADAQTARPDSLTMSCDQVQATIARQGAAVIGTGPHIYDRFVRDARSCSPTQYARQDFIRTANARYCLVYVCRERTLIWDQ